MKNIKMNWKYTLMAAGLVLLVYLVMDFNNRTAELRRLEVQKDRVAAEATQAVQAQHLLDTQIAYATSEPAAKEWAYEEGHMVKPGDNPVVPVQSAGATPVPTPAPVVVQRPLNNWQMWLLLFVDLRSP
jgi:cell division protein FtsB